MPQKKKLSLIIAVVTLFFTLSAEAGSPTFTNLTQDDFNNIAKEYSSNIENPSVMGAESLGHLFGFEAALVAGVNPSPHINDVVQRSAGTSFNNLYNGGLALGLTVPFGITGEAVILPKMQVSGASFQAYSLAGKITLNEDLLSMIPFNLAVRGFYTNSQFSFDQTSGGVNGSVKNKNTVTGLQILVSPRLPIFEPYAGIGFLQAKNNLSVEGTGTVFNYTSAQSADSNPTTTQFLLGINAKLLLLSLGLEYSHAFDSNRYMAKLGFAF